MVRWDVDWRCDNAVAFNAGKRIFCGASHLKQWREEVKGSITGCEND
jgi:hypothetical protein